MATPPNITAAASMTFSFIEKAPVEAKRAC
jgi:hypothetical protein